MNGTTAFDPLFSNLTEDFGVKKKRLIIFNIEYFQKKFTLHMHDNETILRLKELIEQEIDLPIKNQKLKVPKFML